MVKEAKGREQEIHALRLEVEELQKGLLVQQEQVREEREEVGEGLNLCGWFSDHCVSAVRCCKDTPGGAAHNGRGHCQGTAMVQLWYNYGTAMVHVRAINILHM